MGINLSFRASQLCTHHENDGNTSTLLLFPHKIFWDIFRSPSLLNYLKWLMLYWLISWWFRNQLETLIFGLRFRQIIDDFSWSCKCMRNKSGYWGLLRAYSLKHYTSRENWGRDWVQMRITGAQNRQRRSIRDKEWIFFMNRAFLSWWHWALILPSSRLALSQQTQSKRCSTRFFCYNIVQFQRLLCWCTLAWAVYSC